jgi:hypothetical protein
MKPLTLREVAEAIEMHESTVSRVTSNKYLLCDRGLFELKYFFGSGVASAKATARARGRSGQGRDRQADRRRDRDPQRRRDRRFAQGSGLRRRPPDRRQISRGDGHRLVDPAPPPAQDAASARARAAPRSADGRTRAAPRRSCARRRPRSQVLVDDDPVERGDRVARVEARAGRRDVEARARAP